MLQFISTRHRASSVMATMVALAATLAGCADGPPASNPARATRPIATPTAVPALRVVVLGDSLAAGLGLAEADAFPAIVEEMLRDRGIDVDIVNAGVSGDTSAGGLSRLDWVLQQPTDVLVVELGGNDALRGQPLENTERNLREIVRRGRTAGARVVLLGMDVPLNYGPDYGTAFAALYPRIAERQGATLVPGFVRELGDDPELLQPDGLHPTAEGQRRLAEALLPALIAALEAPP